MTVSRTGVVYSKLKQDDDQLIDIQHTDLRASPYSYHPELSTLQRAKMFFLSIVLLPIRATMTGLAFLFALGLANFIIADDNAKRLKPSFSSRRRLLLPIFNKLARFVYFCGGFHYVTVRGNRAPREKAPILVVAPHSSFLDTLAIVVMGLPSVVATTHHANSFIGGVIKVVQPILVHRENPDSRKTTLDEITNRVTSAEDWPQLALFPEGTCSNRQCLLPFRQGAFRPGVPVQPVILRYSNKVDYSWVADGPSAWTLLYMIFTQFSSNMEIEFLPVYTPNEKERADPQLYANNVRRVMATALGVPVCDLHYHDFCRMQLATELQLPEPDELVCIHGLLQLMLESQYAGDKSYSDWVRSRLYELLSVARQKPHIPDEEFVQVLFGNTVLTDRMKLLLQLTVKHLRDGDNPSEIDFRRFCVRACMLVHANEPQCGLELAFKVFPSSSEAQAPSFLPNVSLITESDARELLRHAFNLELPVNPTNGLIDSHQSPLSALESISSDQLCNILATGFPKLLHIYERYQSRLSEFLGRRGRPLLDLNTNCAISHAPCDVDCSSMTNCSSLSADPSHTSNGVHQRRIRSAID